MINKKISRLISKLKKDFRSIHQTEISKKFLKDNFRFYYNKHELSDSGLDRIFCFAEYIYKDEKKSSEFTKNDIWTEFTKKKDHNSNFESADCGSLKSDFHR